jgi:ADP-ribosyl-[dinitrogen reductase] hydrolase
MPKITFYLKPGQNGEFAQKQNLAESGYDIEIRDLTAETWTAALLRPFFDNKPVAEWFNPQAPQILSGEINPATMHAQGALVAMRVDPGLIRGPLVKLAGRCGADLTEAEWPKFLAGKPSYAEKPGVISEFWMHHD